MPPAALDPEASLVDDLGYDSLTIVELMLEFERAFDLEPLPEDAALDATTVGEVVELMVPHVSG